MWSTRRLMSAVGIASTLAICFSTKSHAVLNSSGLILCDAELKIIALVQMPSTSVELVYSQAKLISKLRGDTMLHDKYETRLRVRIIKDVPVTV